MPFDFDFGDLTLPRVLIALAVFAGSLGLTTAIVTLFLVRIPADHFVSKHRGLGRRIGSPVWQSMYVIGKNLAGAVLVIIGLVLALPGVPGQGLLTVFVGILLLDLPRKRRLELRIVRRPAIARTINRVRARFGRPALDLDGATDDDPPSSGAHR
jgi:hypothetical protein